MIPTDPLSILELVFVAFFTWIIIRHYQTPCANFPPGPWGLPIIGSALKISPKTPYKDWMNLSRTYGDVFSLKLNGEPIVVVNGIEAIKEALVKRGTDFADRPKSFLISLFNPRYLGIASGHFTDEWQRQRSFAHTTLKGFGFGKTSMESKIMEEVLELADIFKARVGKSFDVENQFHRSISNIICSMAFGKRFQYNEATFRHLVHHQANFLSLAVRIVFLDGLPAPVQLFFRKSMNDFVYSAEQIKKFCRDQINEHRETLDEHNIRDFIDAYLVEAGNENGVAEEFSDEQLEFVLFDLFGAGTDTIACALKWSILFMMNHPQAQEKVYQEIKKVIGNNRKPTLADRNKLPYTEASLLEIYRLGSVLPIGLPHRTLVDTTLNGHNIPKDTFVSFNLWSINNDAEVWTKPEKFSPERFYDHERNSVRNANSLLPFSAGRRVCMGEQLAKHQMFLFLTTLIQRFKFSVPSGMKNPSERAVAGFSLYPEPYEMLISNRPC